MERQRVNVVGGGVLGLTCALALSERGYAVTVVARDLDLDSVAYASPWAGGFWNSFETDGTNRVAGWERETFARMAELAREDQALVQTVDSFEYFKVEKADEELPWFYRDLCPQPRRLKPEEVAPGYVAGVTFKTFSFNPARFLPYLHAQLVSQGVVFIRCRLSAIDEAFNPGESFPTVPKVDVVVNASGLGALSLIGVEDEAVTPIRGQTVLVRLPKPLTFSCLTSFSNYIITRPSTAGEPGMEAILGGCYEVGNWDTSVDPVLGRSILDTCVSLHPDISKDGTVKGVEVLKHNVGLRPGRHGGPRLEAETRMIPSASAVLPAECKKAAPRKVTLVHCYGIAGAGYQASFGMAKEVADLVDAAMHPVP